MPTFKYHAKSSTGNVVSGTLRAADRTEVIGRLREKDLVVLEVKKKSGDMLAGLKAATLIGGRSRRVARKDLVLMVRQLSTMISAGIPLLESLEVLQEQAEIPGLRNVLMDVSNAIRSGQDLSHALEQHPKVFSNIFVSLVRAGEASGQLDEILVRLAEYLEAAEKLKRDVRAAMTYPVVSLVLILTIASFLLIGIVPKFRSIFASLDIELPAITSFVLNTGEGLKAHWVVALGSLLALVGGLFLFRKTKTGAGAQDWVILHAPVFGGLFRKVALSRFARTFATLIRSGVPILEALEIVSATVGNRVISRVVDTAREHVRQGESLCEPLAKSKVFPPMVTKMVGIGEKSGALELLLEKIAEFYDDQVNAEVKSLTSLIEPLMIGFIGILVAGIVLAVFLPIFKLQEGLMGR
jgi:type IV pilus assembly protein PilC